MNLLKKVWCVFFRVINSIFKVRVRHSLVISLLEKTKEKEKAEKYDESISTRERIE